MNMSKEIASIILSPLIGLFLYNLFALVLPIPAAGLLTLVIVGFKIRDIKSLLNFD